MKLLRPDNTIGYTQKELDWLNLQADIKLRDYEAGTKAYWDAAREFIENINPHAFPRSIQHEEKENVQ